MKYIYLILTCLFLFTEASFAKDFSVNKKGITLYTIQNKQFGRYLSVSEKRELALNGQRELWRCTYVDSTLCYFDNLALETQGELPRLRATSYLPMTLTTNGLEGVNDDVQWKLNQVEGSDYSYIVHKSSGKYLCSNGDSVYVADGNQKNDMMLWKLELSKINLSDLQSPILLMGDDKAGFRDPAVIYHDGTFYMYYSYVLTEEKENIYWYVAMSKSKDLVHWSNPKILTEKGQNKNFASPGNVVRFKDEWILCMQTYCMPGYTRKDPIRYGNQDCRVWIMRSKDLENWSEPELLEVYGPGVELVGMIDAYLLEDKNEKGKWWCFYKPKGGGAGYSWSYDLKNWHPYGRTQCGENVCVWVENNRYLMMHSPHDGMGILQSSDLKNWTVFTEPNILGKENWAWASKRVTAGFVLDLRGVKAVGKYIMFFHGQGPAPQSTEIINSGTDLGISWSTDLKNWEWPGINK